MAQNREKRGGAVFDDDEFEDDDPSSWVPLEPSGDEPLIKDGDKEDNNRGGATSSPSILTLTTDSGNKSFGSATPDNNFCQIASPLARRSENESLGSIQRTLEDRQLLRQTLLHHPMSNFPGKFARNLLIELFRLEAHIRIGLTLITMGALLQAVATLHLLSVYKKHICIALLFLVSYLYVHRADKKVQNINQFFSSLDEPMHLVNTIFAGLENIDSLQLRRVFFAFSVVPLLLEMRTIVFLVETVMDGGWTVISSAAFSMLALSVCNVLSGVPTRDSSLRALGCLYTFALYVTTAQMQAVRINRLASPFVLAAGSLVLYHHSGDFDWLSRSVRQALRSTVGEILAELKGNAAEDEMLQLAALRWIVDYWGSASRPTVGKTYDSTRNSPALLTSSSMLTLSEISDTRTQPSSCDDPIKSEVMTTWLQITTNQMKGEMNMSGQRKRKEHHEKDKENTEAPFENLSSMLGSMDIDSRAKPAVQAYKSAIERIPPSRNVALLLALSSRCPSLYALIFLCLTGTKRHILQSIVTLLPLMLLEFGRVKEWADSRAALSTEVPPTSNHCLPAEHVSDTIFIMLCPDRYDKHQPPQLLQVWNNIRSSVIALERSLLVARCAQTGAAATELSLSILSLSRLSTEICNRGGWAYGLGVLANDFVHFIRYGSCERSGYASAAENAFKNSQVIGRNISALMDEDEGNQLITGVLNVIAASLGRGWIWGVQHTRTDVMFEHKEQGTVSGVEMLCAQKDRYAEDIPDVCRSAVIETSEPAVFCGAEGEEQNMEDVMSSDEVELNNIGEVEVNETGRDVQSASLSLPQVDNSSLFLSEEMSGSEYDRERFEVCTKQGEIKDESSPREEPATPQCTSPLGSFEARQETQSQPLCSENGDDDWKVWAGGGIALVATVVGGIALAGACSDGARSDSDNKKKASEQNEDM